MVSVTYKIRVVRNGQETEVQGDKNFVLEVFSKLEASLNPTKDVKQGKERSEKSAPINKKPVSIREFIQQLEFKKHTDITVAFGYYLEHYTEAKEFTPADINNCYYEAKIESSNTSQMMIQNIKRGMIMPAKGPSDNSRKRYTLTNSGEKFIEAALGIGA